MRRFFPEANLSWKVLAYLAVILPIALVFSSQFRASLELQDDHRIIRHSGSPIHLQVLGGKTFFRSVLDEWREDMTKVGRFRPVSHLAEVGLPKMFGQNPARWHTFLFAIALVVGSLLYVLGLRWFGSQAAAATLALLALLSPDPGPTTVWYRLGPKEALGLLFIVGAALFMTYGAGRTASRRDKVALVLTVIAALIKESFILVIPGMVGLRIWLEYLASGERFRESIKRLRWILGAYLLLFVSCLGLMLYALAGAGSNSYGGSSLATPVSKVLDVVVRGIIQSFHLSAWHLPVIVALALLLLSRDWKKGVRWWLMPTAVFVLWVMPQFLLYATRGGFWDHYWMPCVLAFAALSGAGLKYIATKERWLAHIVFLLVIIWTINAARVDVMAIDNYAQRTLAQQETVQGIAARVPQNGKILIVANMDHQSELAFSLLYFLGAAGSTTPSAYLYDVNERGSQRYSQSYGFPHSSYFSELPPQCMNAVVLLANPGDDPFWDFLGQPNFELKSIRRPQTYLSIRELGWRNSAYGFDVAYQKPGATPACNKNPL